MCVAVKGRKIDSHPHGKKTLNAICLEGKKEIQLMKTWSRALIEEFSIALISKRENGVPRVGEGVTLHIPRSSREICDA